MELITSGYESNSIFILTNLIAKRLHFITPPRVRESAMSGFWILYPRNQFLPATRDEAQLQHFSSISTRCPCSWIENFVADHISYIPAYHS
jgi:hypothetical protein